MGMINTPLLSSQHPHRHRPTCRQLELCLVTVTGFTEWTAKMPWVHWVSNPKRSKGGVEDPKNLGFSKFSADILKKMRACQFFWEETPRNLTNRCHLQRWHHFGHILTVLFCFGVNILVQNAWLITLGSTQLGSFPQIMKINNIWNHHPVLHLPTIKRPPAIMTQSSIDDVCWWLSWAVNTESKNRHSCLLVERSNAMQYTYRNVNYKHIFIIYIYITNMYVC